MPIEMATKLVKRLLAGYPNLGAHDPEGYIAVLIGVMSEYPVFAGQRAIVKVDDENTDFPPTEKKLRSWLDDAVRPYRFVAQWNARAAEQIQEREQAQQPQASLSPRGQIYSNYDDAVKNHGLPFGAFAKERQLSYRG